MDYSEDIKNLVEGLNSEIQSKTLIRNRYTIRTAKLTIRTISFLEKFHKIQIDKGTQPISNLIKKNKLSLFTFYSTGFLECLTNNIPTICFDKNFISFANKR